VAQLSLCCYSFSILRKNEEILKKYTVRLYVNHTPKFSFLSYSALYDSRSSESQSRSRARNYRAKPDIYRTVRYSCTGSSGIVDAESYQRTRPGTTLGGCAAVLMTSCASRILPTYTPGHDSRWLRSRAHDIMCQQHHKWKHRTHIPPCIYFATSKPITVNNQRCSQAHSRGPRGCD
jgi:hypothetical protein